MERRNETLIKLAQTGLMAALCFVTFTFLQIKIPLPGGGATSFHVGNAFCVLAALILGGWYGGLAGAIGMGIADMLDPVYITGAPKTFVLKLCIGLITGLVAHRIAKINESTDKKYIFRWSMIASIAGLAFNVIADPPCRIFLQSVYTRAAAADRGSAGQVEYGGDFRKCGIVGCHRRCVVQCAQTVLMKTGMIHPVKNLQTF